MISPDSFSTHDIQKRRGSDVETKKIIKSLPEEFQPNYETEKRLLLLNMRAMSEGIIIGSKEDIKKDEVEKSRGTHLDHTNRVTRAVEKFSNCFPELKGIESGLKASALYHDIGKTGDNDDPKIQYSIMRLFSLYQENEAEKNEAEESSSKKKMFDMTIEEALEMHDPEEKEAILKIIGAIGLQEKDLMRKVYQSHVTEGINILKKNKFKPEIIYLVGNHHSKSNNFNYDNLPQIDDFPEEERESLEIGSTILELIDSFEASRYRGKSNDQDNFFRLREIYANDVLANKIIDKMEENIGIINEAFESCE